MICWSEVAWLPSWALAGRVAGVGHAEHEEATIEDPQDEQEQDRHRDGELGHRLTAPAAPVWAGKPCDTH
jgi:hypothetical protein